MLYELHHYDIRSSRGLDQVNGRFNDSIIPIWNRIGIEPVGFWPVIIGASMPRLTYLLAWEDLAQRQALWEAFEADPEWRHVVADTNAAWGGSPIHTLTSSILRPTAFSRLPRRNNQPVRLRGGIFELRTYHFEETFKLTQAVGWFEEQAQVFEEHGLYFMGYWTTAIGVAPRLTCMLVFENLAHRERSWAQFYTDPLWTARQDGLYPNGQPLVTCTESAVMKGSNFSGWR